MEMFDLSQHRVLIVGGKTHGLMLLRSVLGIAGLSKTVHVEDPNRALEMLQTDPFSAVFTSQLSTIADGSPFVIACRRKEGVMNPMIPVFLLKDRTSRRDVEMARDQGVTDIFTAPLSPRTLCDKLKAAFQAPRPFIVSHTFFGPDRRSGARPPWYGEDRRTRRARKTRLDAKVRKELTFI